MATPHLWIVTANFTEDGAVAYRRADGTWSRVFTEAGVVDSEANAKQHATTSAQREQREVSDPYVIEVAAVDGVIQPQSARERIRANGPTIRIRRPD